MSPFRLHSSGRLLDGIALAGVASADWSAKNSLRDDAGTKGAQQAVEFADPS
jgi:hypothetical protein